MRKHLYLLIICLLLFVSCKDIEAPDELNNVLSLAGDNKDELLETIDYFQSSGDSLKLQAACFLIRNLKGKYSYTGESFDELQNIIASYRLDTITDIHLLRKAKDYIEKELSIYSSFDHSKIADAQYISSEYLINYIEDSFKALEMPWTKGKISFDQFCRYVLPYKVGNEPIENWRAAVLEDYRLIIDSLSKTSADLAEVAKIVNDEIAENFEARGASKISLSFGYNDLKRIRTGSCYNAVTYTMYVMRALGIPIGMDLSHQWGNRSGGHQWTVLYLPDGNTIPFDPTYNFKYFRDRFNPKVSRTVLPPKYAAIAKIFSVPFEDAAVRYTNQGDIPHVFKQNLIDVTDRYTSTSDIQMQVKSIPSHAQHAYLFVFDINNWVPVQMSGVSRDSTVFFEKMGKGVVYLPGYFILNSVIPFDYPFVQDKKGEIRRIIPEKDKLTEIIIYRKYPYLERVKSFAARMLGGVFQVANSPDFSDRKTVLRITKIPDPYYQEIAVKDKGRYRYFRYLAADSCYGDIAEIEVYSGSSENPVYGKIIGTQGESKSCGIEKAFDQDKLSYYTSLVPDSNWVGIDFGKEIQISKIRYLPRNDQNTIEPGDDYELFYWDNQWISLGVQRAEKHYLKYKVPNNALLWLRNLSRGKEERIFTYEKGKQVWW